MIKRNIGLIIYLALITFIFIYKLDYPYFFTDEILYINSGREHLNGIYTNTMQVPLLTKYIAATMYHLVDHNVFLIRLPFALMGIFTTFILYKILKREYGKVWGISGMILFVSSNIIYSASRMVMLEPLMHLTWLGYLYLYYLSLEKNQTKLFLYSGIILGLALATKVTSFLLIPFSIVFIPYFLKKHRTNLKEVILKYSTMYFSGATVFISTYIHSFFTSGEKYTIKAVWESLVNVYFTKSMEGKTHIINNNLYTKSPSWTYAYYIYIKEGILRIVTYLIGLISSFFNKSIFELYWFVFFLLSFIFHQLSGVKNIRYISSFEIPLIILVTSGFYYLSTKWKYAKTLFLIIITTFFLSNLVYAVTQPRTEYNALFENYLKYETNNFTSNDKIYIYGSTRSSRWYKHGKGEGKEMFEISNDLEAHCPSFYRYNYLILEKDELQRYGDNMMYKHVITNKNNYQTIDQYEFLIFKRTNENEMVNVCN